MATDTGEENLTLSPNDAFAVLGNETRMEILQTLGEADEPLSFTELRERVGMRDSGQFNYHLNQLTGHFVRQTEERYKLRRGGERVIEAVLSGAVTDDPVLEPTETDLSCWYCGAPVEVSFHEERATVYCTECGGAYGDSVGPGGRARLGYLYLPPAGLQGRSPAEMYHAAVTWGNLELLAWGNTICPRCSAPLEAEVRICEGHDAADGLCDACDQRYGVRYHIRCTNCILAEESMFMVRLLANTDFRGFLIDHGIDPVSPAPQQFGAAMGNYDEEVLSRDPFEARFTFTIDGDALTLTVNDELTVIDATEHKASDPV